ncbi:cation:proton antiporter domain-containing protein [Treponema sp.]|uniref:cation:proton antiporter domain-containing protein n=1 Tax=Treponema sp. TaxID=166 RepID=UPI003F056E61
MSDPLAQVLPQVFHFSRLQGTQFVLLLGIIMFFGALGGRIFQKLKIPQVVGYIVMGILIGSSGFQILRLETIIALSPVNTVALSLIGFLIGAELKIDSIKKYGRQFVGILIGESITPFFVVFFLVSFVAYTFMKDFKTAVSFGLVLGAICAATAPAATTDVLKEYRTRGPLTTTTLGIVAMDDAVALILYAVASTVVSPLLGGQGQSFGAQMLCIAKDIFGSVLIGGVFGAVVAFSVRNLMKDEGRVLSFGLGGIFLSTGVCVILGLDNILAAMSLGFFMVNFAPVKTRPIFTLVEKFTPPIYVLFFVLVGAKLNIWVVTPVLGILAVIYVAGRTIGKTFGARLGARITKAPKTVHDFLPWCLLSQAGVAIGLSIAASSDFENSIGPSIVLIITATTFIVQLVGPVCVKHGVTKAGEVGLAVTEEDILKSSRVDEVSWGSEKLCSRESFAVVKDTEKICSILTKFETHHNQSFAVSSSETGKLAGIITLEHLKETLVIGEFADTLLAVDIMDKPVCTCRPEDFLPDVYKKFSDMDTDSIPIVDSEGIPLGVMEKIAADHYLHMKIFEINSKLECMA